MVNTKKSGPGVDLVAGLCGLFFTLSGISGVKEVLYNPHNGWDWKVSIGLIIFGSMIMGVALNRIANSPKSAKVVTKQRSKSKR